MTVIVLALINWDKSKEGIRIFISCTNREIHILSNAYPGYGKKLSIQNFICNSADQFSEFLRSSFVEMILRSSLMLLKSLEPWLKIMVCKNPVHTLDRMRPTLNITLNHSNISQSRLISLLCLILQHVISLIIVNQTLCIMWSWFCLCLSSWQLAHEINNRITPTAFRCFDDFSTIIETRADVVDEFHKTLWHQDVNLVMSNRKLVMACLQEFATRIRIRTLEKDDSQLQMRYSRNWWWCLSGWNFYN